MHLVLNLYQIKFFDGDRIFFMQILSFITHQVLEGIFLKMITSSVLT